MDIKFVGVGGFADTKFGNSSAVIRLNNYEVLIDCGNMVYATLRKKNLENSFKYVLVTHLHDDHVGSLSSLIIHRWKYKGGGRLTVLYPDEGFKEELRELLCHSLGPNPEAIMDWQLLDEMPEIQYINTFGKHIPGMRSYAYFFVENNEIFAYSGDIAKNACIFKELERYVDRYKITVFHEVAFARDEEKVHTGYKKLEKYSNIGDIYCYHCDPTKRPTDMKLPLVYENKEMLF